jgi:DNA-binding transcriptional ArsR family regulator
MAFDARKRVDELRKDLRELCKQRQFIEEQLVNVNLALNSLVRGLEDDERQEVLREIAAARRKPGLTERISQSLRIKPHSYLPASEVREWLEREGVDLSGYSQPLATISITLSRMQKAGRVSVRRKGRNVMYRWKGDLNCD